MVKRLHEYKGKEMTLFLDSPLYERINIEKNIEIKSEYEQHFRPGNTDQPDAIYEHSLFLENKDFIALKEIFFNKEFRDFHYCPFCHKEVTIIYRSIHELKEELSKSLLTSDLDISSEEQYMANLEHAKFSFKGKYESVIDILFNDRGMLTIDLTCTGKEQHSFNTIFFLENGENLIKIGQTPSVRDFDNSTTRYKGILNKDKQTLKELNISVGLKSHGVGVGSFVYLRRILERLIFKKFQEFSLKVPEADETSFRNLRMKDKVTYLKEVLPEFLVENTVLYGILSKGIHELTEQECLENYDVLYKAIVIILEQQLEMEERYTREKEIQKSLQNIKTK